MADMIAGSIHRKYQINKTDAKIYYAVIKKNDPLSRLVVPDTLPYGNSSKSGSLYFYYNIKKFLVKFMYGSHTFGTDNPPQLNNPAGF